MRSAEGLLYDVGSHPCRELGFELEKDAAEALVARIPRDEKKKPVRLRQQTLMRELEKLALYAGEGTTVDADTVALLTRSGDARMYELADAVIDGDRERAVSLAEKLRDQDEDMMYILFALLRQIRTAHLAWAMLDSGKSPQEIQSALAGSTLHRQKDRRAGEEPGRGAVRARARSARGARLGDQRRGRARSGERPDADAGRRRRGPGAARRLARARRRAARDFLRAALLRMKRAVLGRLVDLRDQRPVLGVDRVAVVRLDGALETAEVGLDGRGAAAVLEPLAL